MMPLPLPRSSACSVLTASESMATSCVAQNTLFSTTMASSRLKCALKSTIAAIRRVTIIIRLQATIQALRPPSRCSLTRSMTGAQAHLNAHGRKSAATKVPINASDTPCWRMNATMAIEVKPYGMPSETYSSPNVRKRPFLRSRRLPGFMRCDIAIPPCR